jgi:hypothetical protein
VAVGSSYKRVSDFVEHGVSYCLFGTLHRENPAQRDKPVRVAAASKPAFGVVPLESPAGQAVCGHQQFGLSLSLEKVHRLALSVDLLGVSLPA